jgi:hypothetical protein
MSDDFALLGRELKILENIQVELAASAVRTDDRRRHDLIRLRRNLSQQIAKVGELADPIFASAQDPSVARTYRAKFSGMRSAAAIHQSNWPAVRLGESVEEFQQSALGVRKANREFIEWVRDALAQLGGD